MIDAELVDSAMSSIGCEEELIADVLCTSSDKELTTMMQFYAKWKGDSLQWKISRKTVPNSPFQTFIKLILQSPSRQTNPPLSSETLHQYADDLLHNGLNSNSSTEGRNDEIIFPILIQTPREQCSQLSEILFSKSQHTLHELISSHYKGSISYTLQLWLESSLISAQAHRLHRLLIKQTKLNKLNLNSFLAKYDRNSLIDILNRCDELYPEVNMEERVYSNLSGHHREAAEGWINNHTCDGDHENAIKEMMLEYERDETRLDDERWMNKLTTHLDGENAVLAKYITVHKVDLPRSLSVEARLKPLPPGSKRNEYLASQHREVQSDQSHVWDDSRSQQKNGEGSVASPQSAEEHEWNRKCKLVMDLLAERFALEDVDNSGTLGMSTFSV
jgi:hypothetical protein